MTLSNIINNDRRDRQRKGRVVGQIERTLDSAQQLLDWFAQQAGEGLVERARRIKISEDAMSDSFARIRDAEAKYQRCRAVLEMPLCVLDRAKLVEANRLAQEANETLRLERHRLDTPDHKASVVRQMLPIWQKRARRLARDANAWDVVFKQAKPLAIACTVYDASETGSDDGDQPAAILASLCAEAVAEQVDYRMARLRCRMSRS